MTAAIGAEAASGGAAAGASKAAPAAAPTGSGPVGTAPSGAGKAGYKPRTRPQLSPSSGSKSAPRNKGGVGGKTTTTRKGRTTTTSNKRSGFPLFFGGRKGKHGGKGGHGQARSLLMGEFVACAVIVALSPLTDRHKTEGPAKAMKRITAVAGVFLVLALVSTGGKSATRVAAAFGGLVTVALLVSERDLFTVIAKRFNDASDPAGPAGPAGDGAAPPDAPARQQLGPVESIPGFNSPPPNTGHWWDGITGGLGPI